MILLYSAQVALLLCAGVLAHRMWRLIRMEATRKPFSGTAQFAKARLVDIPLGGTHRMGVSPYVDLVDVQNEQSDPIESTQVAIESYIGEMLGDNLNPLAQKQAEQKLKAQQIIDPFAVQTNTARQLPSKPALSPKSGVTGEEVGDLFDGLWVEPQTA